MAYAETELKQADQLDRVVENVLQGDCDLFEGVEARQLTYDAMAVVDLATFVMPLRGGDGKEFDQRMHLLVAHEVECMALNDGAGSGKAMRGWLRFMDPILEAGSAIAAFFASFFLEPVPTGREGRSIDTFSRPWYNITVDRYLVGVADSDAGGLLCFGFSDAGSGYRATACR
ncbi:MAG: hypothetical protein NTX94_03315 [Caldiserica bacterium]|nr:hypothetical protein [Caldisericota bacterium]